MSATWRTERGALQIGTHRLHYALTLPERMAEEPFPAVLYVPPLGARAVDTPVETDEPLLALLGSWSEAGFATLRSEPESGSSSASDAGAELAMEIDAYRCALGWLAGRTDVAARSLFVFGASLGGVLAPSIARGVALRGVVVFGAPSRPWSECLARSARRQLALARLPADVIALEAARAERLYRGLLREGERAEDLLRADAELAASVAARDLRGETLHGRSLAYFRAIEGIDLEQSWRAVGAPVLALRGEHDWIVEPDDHERIASWVVSTGACASARTLPGVDHDMRLYPSSAESYRERGRGDVAPSVARTIVDWMRGRLQSRIAG